MEIRPQLAHNVDVGKLDRYIEDNRYFFEQKLDGVRLVVTITNGLITGKNRRDRTVTLDYKLRESLHVFPNDPGTQGDNIVVLDGELLATGEFHVFDAPYVMMSGQVITDTTTPFDSRRAALEAIAGVIFDNQTVFLVPTARTSTAKRKLLSNALKHSAEGIMVKDTTAHYTVGRRSDSTLKAKFTKTADCVIMIPRYRGKSSCSIGLFDDEGQMYEVGSVKMVEPHIDKANPGDVIEVRYLYATEDDRLYQPVFMTYRDDKDPFDCKLDQLVKTNKEAMTHGA